jgi:hypothetical protein
VLNGVDITASAIVTATGATYTTGSPLPSGDNAASAQIADRAANVQTPAINFTVAVFEASADCAPTSGIIPLNVRFEKETFRLKELFESKIETVKGTLMARIGLVPFRQPQEFPR